MESNFSCLVLLLAHSGAAVDFSVGWTSCTELLDFALRMQRVESQVPEPKQT